jgi:hypothetical protein
LVSIPLALNCLERFLHIDQQLLRPKRLRPKVRLLPRTFQEVVNLLRLAGWCQQRRFRWSNSWSSHQRLGSDSIRLPNGLHDRNGGHDSLYLYFLLRSQHRNDSRRQLVGRYSLGYLPGHHYCLCIRDCATSTTRSE